MGSETSRSNTYVANASGCPIRVYYSVDKVIMTEMVVEIQVGGGGGTFSASGNTKMVFKPDSRVRYVHIPKDDFAKFSGDGVLYASVFVENPGNSNECLQTISMNYHVPSDRSFIVTENHAIKFQKYGANIWEDEQGIVHRH